MEKQNFYLQTYGPCGLYTWFLLLREMFTRKNSHLSGTTAKKISFAPTLFIIYWQTDI